MNTQHMKKNAIAKQLGEMLTHSCQYSPETPASWGKIEPDTNALAIFQTKISWMAHRHFENILTIQDVEEVYNYCYKIGYSVGHVLSQGTTGSWGVRLSQLNNIIEILQVEDFETVGRGDFIAVLDKYEMKIERVEISANWVWIHGKITNEYGYVEEFPISYNWNDVYKLAKV